MKDESKNGRMIHQCIIEGFCGPGMIHRLFRPWYTGPFIILFYVSAYRTSCYIFIFWRGNVFNFSLVYFEHGREKYSDWNESSYRLHIDKVVVAEISWNRKGERRNKWKRICRRNETRKKWENRWQRQIHPVYRPSSSFTAAAAAAAAQTALAGSWHHRCAGFCRKCGTSFLLFC